MNSIELNAKVQKIPYRDIDGNRYIQYTITYADGSGEFVRIPEVVAAKDKRKGELSDGM